MIVQDSEAELEIRFESACTMADGFTNLICRDANLLYGLRKQAEEGDNYTPTPWLWNIPERYKWEAWNQQEGKTRVRAKTEYIHLVANFQAKYE